LHFEKIMRPLILISNDDGVDAPGLRELINMLSPLGDLLVVAPDAPRSGFSHALTVDYPLKIKKIEETAGLTIYSCSGTPADCVKIAKSCLLPKTPSLMVSGINHGSNSSINIIYSGTMGAAAEAAILGIPSIGFSLCDHSQDADFSDTVLYGRAIAKEVLEKGLAPKISLNVNVPLLPKGEIKGVKICRQGIGQWNEIFEKKIDPDSGEELYWLDGYYVNEELDAEGTDETALKNGYISVVPVQFDFTAHNVIGKIKNIEKVIF